MCLLEIKSVHLIMARLACKRSMRNSSGNAFFALLNW